MKHFDIWQWADFVRGLGNRAARSAMETHLASRCPRCQGTVDVLRRVVATAATEAAFEPPDHAVRIAKTIFPLQRPDQVSFPRLVARLVYDSVREPLPAGLRAQDRLSRHALYEAGSHHLDLQLEQHPTTGLITLVGQLADRSRNATEGTSDLPVWLMDRKTLVASTRCNRFGEFQLEFAPARNLRLSVPLSTVGKRLDIPLDRLSPRAPRKFRQTKVSRKASRRKPDRVC